MLMASMEHGSIDNQGAQPNSSVHVLLVKPTLSRDPFPSSMSCTTGRACHTVKLSLVRRKRCRQSVHTLLRFSSPPMTRSTAASKSIMPMASLSDRAAIRAASLQMFAISAPAKPGVRAARRSEKCSRGFSSRILDRCKRKICSRPWMSGLPEHLSVMYSQISASSEVCCNSQAKGQSMICVCSVGPCCTVRNQTGLNLMASKPHRKISSLLNLAAGLHKTSDRTASTSLEIYCWGLQTLSPANNWVLDKVEPTPFLPLHCICRDSVRNCQEEIGCNGRAPQCQADG